MRKLSIAILFLSQFFGGVHAQDIALTAEQIVKLGIATTPLPARTNGDISDLPAQVVIPGNQLYTISTPLSAMVEQTLVGVGDAVKKGQVLARLQSPAFIEAQRRLLQAHLQDQLATENFKRDQELWQDGIIAESRLRATRSQRNEAHAILTERHQALKLFGMPSKAIEQLLSDNELSSQLAITSPIDGVILDKSASSGQRLDASTPLFQVARLSPLGLEIQIPLASSENIKVGAAVDIPAYSASGKVAAIGRSLSGGSQTIRVRALINKGTEGLRPGQYVEANIATAGNGMKQWNVPNSALARLGKQPVVFVRTPTGFRAEKVSVKLEGAQRSLIGGDFKGDELIAVQGVSTLKSGAMSSGAE
ncbi:efflux RND transporter periplasmic adaptor subunit [Ferrigenium sp. UT5]|uniref:efflux RND transporter periplasmic adaptor subunit n=1 Tax=Ferrigenium sp. UT5 TaxID=3242105 RepID=UPI003552E948